MYAEFGLGKKTGIDLPVESLGYMGTSKLPGHLLDYFEDRNQFIHSLNRYSLLIIDDLGIERNSDFALEQVFNVIDSRYRSKKPLIITTNLTLSELNNTADIAHKRIYDRILERCIPVRINNRNIRQDNATANLKKTKKILLDNHTSNQS